MNFKAFVFIVCNALPLVLAASASCQTTCQGFLFRPKKDSVVVYKEPDLTSEVLGRLSLGQRVCRVGAKGKFEIVQFGEPQALAFVRTVDLWEHPDSRGPRDQSLFARLRSYIRYLQYGGVPDDALDPYRPIIGAPTSPPGPPAAASSSASGGK